MTKKPKKPSKSIETNTYADSINEGDNGPVSEISPNTTAVSGDPPEKPELGANYFPYIPVSKASFSNEYYPSNQAWPWTDLTDKQWNTNDYVQLWQDKDIQKETKLKIDNAEIKKIFEFNSKLQCHSYRLSKINIWTAPLFIDNKLSYFIIIYLLFKLIGWQIPNG